MTKNNNPLYDALLLIKSAKTDIQTANAQISAFNSLQPYGVVNEVDSKTGEIVAKARIQMAIPDDIRMFIRSAADKLRASLDFLASQLAINNSKSASGVYFPIANSAQEFKGKRVREKIKKLSPAAQNFICGLEPYKGGKGERFWILNRIRKPGAHTHLVTIAKKASRDSVGIRNGYGGLHVPNLTDYWQSLDEGIEIIRCPPTSYWEYNFQLTVQITLGEIEAIKTEPIIPLLVQFADSVEDVIISAQRLFF